MKSDDGEPNAVHESASRVRSFFALPVTGEALDVLRRARDALKRRAERSRVTVRFLSDDALHVTLCFLGFVGRDAISDFTRVLEESARVSPMTARFAGLGAFSSPKRARVVVAELADPEGRIAELARTIALGAEKLGVPLEARAFRPHVTLARLKRPSDVHDWLDHATLDPVALSFGEVRLYQSLGGPGGGRYSVLARAEFRGRGA